RQQVHAQVIDVHGQLAKRLRRIGVHEDAVFPGNGGDLAHRLDRADLVVGVHDADERGAAINRLADGVEINKAVAIHREDRDTAAEPPQELARLKRGRVLHGAGDDVGVACPTAEDAAELGKDHSFDGVVTRLSAAAGEDNL